MMCDICGDNRFEVIEAYKRKLIEATNIESSPEEMAVIDNVLFRFWQMGWLSSAEPTQTNTSNALNAFDRVDLISRAGVIDWYCKWECDSKYCGIPCREVEEMQSLPSAEPQRRKGKWIYLDGWDAFECSVCGRQMVRNIFDYCPWCGAKMEGST